MTPREQAETIIDIVTLGAMHNETIRVLEAAIRAERDECGCLDGTLRWALSDLGVRAGQ